MEENKGIFNPFQVLYVTETVPDQEFVSLVSPMLVEQMMTVFMPGNVVVQGTQGSGKTTLLSLLKYNIQKAYESSGIPFPIPETTSKFLSAGINLTRSGILDIGRRPIKSQSISEENQLFPLIFADFFNYHIAHDLLSTIKLYANSFDTPLTSLEAFATAVSKNDCWFEGIAKCSCLDAILEVLNGRISVYRKYHQYNIETLPGIIKESITGIGKPLSVIASLAKEYAIIPNDLHVFIRIDQLEVLLNSDEIRSDVGISYRRMINTALSTRDPHISYKIGTRTHAWKKELRIYNSSTLLEDRRDYFTIDVDDIIQRNENSSSWIYPKFIEDVYYRRLVNAGITTNSTSKDKILKGSFGSGLKNNEIADKYCRNSTAERAIPILSSFSSDKRALILELFLKDKLNAILAAAWILQDKELKFSLDETLPWKRSYWEKERIRIALLQIASNCRQRLTWCGYDDITNLSTGGILCFISLCQHIWDIKVRDAIDESDDKRNMELNPNQQEIGVYSTSTLWFNKIIELPGGNIRQKFVSNLGAYFRTKLLSDKKMSNPGYTGFSLACEFIEADANRDVMQFLNDATDYGVLTKHKHTSKSKKKELRMKWYFNPIYCPFIQLFEARIKEPYYATVDEVRNWINCARDNKPITDGQAPVLGNLFTGLNNGA